MNVFGNDYDVNTVMCVYNNVRRAKDGQEAACVVVRCENPYQILESTFPFAGNIVDIAKSAGLTYYGGTGELAVHPAWLATDQLQTYFRYHLDDVQKPAHDAPGRAAQYHRIHHEPPVPEIAPAHPSLLARLGNKLLVPFA